MSAKQEIDKAMAMIAALLESNINGDAPTQDQLQQLQGTLMKTDLQILRATKETAQIIQTNTQLQQDLQDALNSATEHKNRADGLSTGNKRLRTKSQVKATHAPDKPQAFPGGRIQVEKPRPPDGARSVTNSTWTPVTIGDPQKRINTYYDTKDAVTVLNQATTGSEKGPWH